MTILYFYHNLSCIFLLAFAHQQLALHKSTLIASSTISNITISVKRSNFTLVFFKAAYHTNPFAVRKRARSSSNIPRHILKKFSNTSVDDDALL